MLKELIKEADTVEAAVELAAEELNVSAEDLEIEVLQEPQKKACQPHEQKSACNNGKIHLCSSGKITFSTTRRNRQRPWRGSPP